MVGRVIPWVSNFARTLLDDANAAAVLTTLGVTADAQTILANAEVGTWTPTFNFATAGDLSVSYSTQYGYYMDFGDVVFITCLLQCTPTYTTASGTFRILGLPFTPAGVTHYLSPVSHASSITYPAGKTFLAAYAETFGGVRLFATGSASVSAALSTTQMPSGGAQSISFSGVYAH